MGKIISLNESQLTYLVKEAVRNILSETPECDKNLSADEKKAKRLERGDWENRVGKWDDPEEKRQRSHKTSRNVTQDTRKKGHPIKRGEFTGQLKRGDY